MNTEQRRHIDSIVRQVAFDTEQRDTSYLNQTEPNTADPKHIPTSFSEWLEQNGDDIGGNWIADRVESNKDQYLE